MGGDNSALGRAGKAKDDEFYTQREDIERELKNYRRHFKNKTVLCNCDDPTISCFFRYFSLKFEFLQIKRLITTCYKNRQKSLFSTNSSTSGIYMEYTGNKNNKKMPDLSKIKPHRLDGDGDFRSEECIDILKQSDIVVTNPPFSLFREYVDQLVSHRKKFLIIGNQNAIAYKEIFKLLKDNKIWLGYHAGDMKFKVPAHYKPRKTRYWKDETGQKWRSLGTVCWFTNLSIKKRSEDLPCYKKYAPKYYQKYDQYDAINVSKYSEIPVDYYGVMGVPLTFMNRHNPGQFKLIGLDRYVKDNPRYGHRFSINGKQTYARVLIKRRRKDR